MWLETQETVATLVAEALRRAQQAGGLPVGAVAEVPVERPERQEHGDLATPVALGLARSARMAPRAIAERIAERLPEHPWIERVEIAGPGFLNFFLSRRWYEEALRQVLARGREYGRSSRYAGRRALVEFVSANPTGPLTLGHGRQAVIGDVICRLLEAVGYSVTREYYFNDAGRQMRVLAESVRCRYLEELGRPVAFPEDGYQGEYIREIARELVREHGAALADLEDLRPFQAKAVAVIFEEIRRTLKRLGVQFDSYFNEHKLFEESAVQRVLDDLAARGLLYEKDGALWFRATALGRPQDRVFVRSTGDREPTYRVPDIAYHRNKIERGYDLIVDIFGADHIEEFPDVKAALEGLGYRTDHLVALFHQFVTITRDGEVVKMSTRRANFVTLDELIDEVGGRRRPVLFHHAEHELPPELRSEPRKDGLERKPGLLSPVRPRAHLQYLPPGRGDGDRSSGGDGGPFAVGGA
ncbi:MAG: hypothetical protein KatS3mg115_2029 [Candidatus Poribacteria bacterium]|nr:MAG: hypothetical protein KatS3mg115_2029 [Candidatus Poribacteria bacterium]